MARCMRARVRCPLAMPIEIQTIVATPNSESVSGPQISGPQGRALAARALQPVNQ